ncbi:sulfatase-like hydrolase/transferase [Thermoflavifilum aggregans]|uniref:sulfatase-like hydrolase/transferase n=1 Tax=Thermoflavifilum aggregans TaxID=454188 RepID=UPI0037438849
MPKIFIFSTYYLSQPSGRQVCVFIIGESSRYDHWHINGYSRNTSPSLDTMHNLISFRNVFFWCLFYLPICTSNDYTCYAG